MPRVTPRHPWDRLPDESPKAYTAFLAYRDCGPDRSIPRAAGVADAYPGGYRHHWWKRWSTQYRWVSRCEAWDDFIHEQAESDRIESQLRLRQEQIAEDERQARSRLSQARLARSTAAAMIAKLAAAVREGGELASLPARQLLPHLAKIAALLGIGMTEERKELAALSGQPKVGQAESSDDVVEAARDILAEMNRQVLMGPVMADLSAESGAGILPSGDGAS